VNLFVASTNKIIVAQGADILASKGTKGLKKYVLLFEAMLMGIWMLYSIGLWSVYDCVVTVLGDKYQGIGGYVGLWSLFCFVNLLRSPISNALVVLTEFKAAAKYDMAGAFIVLAACLVLIVLMEGKGAVTALILGELVMLVLSARRLIRAA